MNTIRRGWYAGVVASLTSVALAVPGIAAAGPGCMNDQRMSRGYYPHSPMGPQAAYGRVAPHPYYGARTPWRTAAPYNRQMPAKQGDSNGGDKTVMASAAQSSRTAAGDDSKSASESITVRIDGMRFEPASITVEPGTKVTWVHGGRMPHTITGNAEGLGSSTLQQGQSYSHTFTDSGLYNYYCSIHPSMTGSVVVKESGTDS